MAAGVGQQHGVVRRGLGQRVVNGKALDVRARHFVPFRLVPSATDDPSARLGLARRRSNHGDDIVPGTGIAKIQGHLECAESREVTVPFDESGDRQLTAEVDHVRRRPNVFADFRVRSDRLNPAARYSNGLRGRFRRIHRDDLAIAQYEVGRGGSQGRGEGQKEGEGSHGATSAGALGRLIRLARSWYAPSVPAGS